MTQEEKQLLLKELCTRLPYGVRVKVFDEGILSVGNHEKGVLDGKETMSDDYFVIKCNKDSWLISCEDFKPYLRPMSSMTEEEKIGYQAYFNYDGVEYPEEYIDWLNEHHFDYRGLIPMGLALEAPEGMYKGELL